MLPLPLRRVLLALSKMLQGPTQWLSFSLLRMMSPRKSVRGVELVDTTGRTISAAANTVEAALRLIAQVDPIRFARLRLDLKHVVLATHGGPEYTHVTRSCLLSASDVQRQSPERVAMTLVHEATHARLSRAGFARAWSLRCRLELRCVHEEIAFAMRIPGTESLIDQARNAMENPWFTGAPSYLRPQN